jgi:glycosyltransferase involved in cell wall biosynthesis
MMSILHISPSYVPAYRYGGPIRSVHGLCKALVRRGHDVHVFTTSVDGDKDSDVPLHVPVDIDGVKVRYFRSRYLRRLFWSPQMKKALEREVKSFDILHLHSIFLWPTWAAARAARDENIPYIISPRGMLVKDLIKRKSRFAKTVWIDFIERKNIEHAAAVHFTSRLEEEEARNFRIRFPGTFTIPNGIEDELLDEEEITVSPRIQEVMQKGRYILFLGRVNWKKGLDRLINAMKLIPGVNLVIVGNDEEGYRQELDQLAGRQSVSDRVIFTGPVYGKEKIAILRNAALFVLPSYSENFGIAVIEAMAVGCPVVVTPQVGLARTVEETGAWLVIEGEPEKLGNAVRNLLANPELLSKMGKEGRSAIVAGFTWDAIAEEMEKQYCSVTSRRQR